MVCSLYYAAHLVESNFEAHPSADNVNCVYMIVVNKMISNALLQSDDITIHALPYTRNR